MVWVPAGQLVKTEEDRKCRCGHPEAEHVVGGQECAIDRRWRYRGQPCGCERFQQEEG
jgi:hypothetical protein